MLPPALHSPGPSSITEDIFMKKLTIITGLVFAMFCVSAPTTLLAAATNDGMPIDEKIKDSIDLDRNTSYIYVKALSQMQGQMTNMPGMEKDLNLGSIIVSPGADVGDITLVFKGDNNVLVNH
jgi:hypothetical protein